jgi:hypothetical protein
MVARVRSIYDRADDQRHQGGSSMVNPAASYLQPQSRGADRFIVVTNDVQYSDTDPPLLNAASTLS